MTENATCRPFVALDAGACLKVFESNIPAFFLESERAEFKEFLDNLPGPYLVIERAGSVVGCGGYALEEGGGIAVLCWGMIRSELHGSGLGTLLLEKRLELALCDPSIHTLALSTSQLTTGFYERFGFVLRSTQRDGYGVGLDRCDMTRAVLQR